MTKIEIIVHCYAEEHPEFAKLLTMQLSSLALWPPKAAEVMVTVCCLPSDLTTRIVLSSSLSGSVRAATMRKECLFRRAIGRNAVAKASQADIVWFCDADYLFGEGCLDALAEAYEKGFPHQLVFPKHVLIQKSHRIGDEQLNGVVPGNLYHPDLSLFTPRTERMAIGGLQIVSGDTARAFGYCDGTRWVEPVSAAGGFRNTVEDKIYRALLGGGRPITLPNLYRCRHSASAFESAESRLSQTERVG